VAAAAGVGAALRLPAHAQGARRLKIGYVSPQTGPLAAFGEADKFVIGEVQKLLKDGLTSAGASTRCRWWCGTASRIPIAPARSRPI
jgi:branched-chain amino acid transport system substrate-binding protein